MNTKNKLLIIISGLIILILITIGASYAFFTANLTGGEETKTITVTGGTMNINYNGGANINVANIIPSNDPAAIKTFIVTGNNTTDLPMQYKIILVVEANTFSEEALKYKLISTNTDNNGTVVPSKIELTNVGTGSKTIELGVGEFTSPTNGNKIHTYSLEIYFPNTAYNQNADQEKEIRAYIRIENYQKPLGVRLNEVILAQGGGASAISAKTSPNFAQNSSVTDTGLYALDDEYGTSYYYRGERNLLNNNLIFGGFQWKIIRINGDGTTRIIYNGTEAQFTTKGTMNTTEDSTQISGIHMWNLTNTNDAKYVGYMYGGANGVASTVRNGITSSSATYNETSTNAKVQLDNWYQTNILGKAFEGQIVDNIFCNDRQLSSEVGGPATGTGYGSSATNYSAYYRLFTNKTPTLKCGLQNDRFTKSDTALGNGSLTYPVGLISADETVGAGFVYAENNVSNYLNTNRYYWTSTPFNLDSRAGNRVWNVGTSGGLVAVGTDDELGLRPVINLDSNLTVTGDGSAINPYRVS